MLAGLFRSNQPAVLFLVPVVLVALLPPTFPLVVGEVPEQMPLAALVDHLLGTATWTRHLLACLLVGGLSVQLTAMVNSLELMDRRNHLVALLFPVVLAGLGGKVLYDPALLGMPLVLFALRRTWSVNNNGPALGVLFDAGFLLGLASLFYMPYAFLLVVVWTSISVIRPFAWREYVLPVVGIALVHYLCWAVLFLLDRTPWQPLHTLVHYRAPAQVVVQRTLSRSGFWVLLGGLVVVSLSAFSANYARSIMRGKNLRASFLAFTMALGVLAVLMFLLNGGFPPVLAAGPLAVLCGYALLAPKRPWLAELSVLLLFSFAVWIRWVG